MTALTAGGAGFTPHGASELKTGTRSQFSRGLAGSSAVHFLLLALFLAASGTGDRVLRTYDSRTDLVLEPFYTLPPPPIDVPRISSGPPPDVKDGTYDPVIEPPDIDMNPVTGTPLDRTPFGAKTTGEPDDGRPASPHTGDPAPDAIYVVVDQLPVPTVAPKPVYPPWALEAGITGRVLLHVLVGTDGRVRQIVVKEGVKGLSEAAYEAVLQWVFRPASVRGVPVSTWVSIPVVFRQ